MSDKQRHPSQTVRIEVPSLHSASPARATLADALTVVCTTSPIPDHPSTALLDETIGSFALVPELLTCRVIIVCDGTRQDLQGSSKFKRGLVTEADEENYRQFISNVQARISAARLGEIYSNCELLVLDSHHGFGWALWQGLKRCLTPYVLVAQHDYTFERSVDLSAVVGTMASHQAVKYVGLYSASHQDYQAKVRSKYKLHIDLLPGLPIPLLPILPLTVTPLVLVIIFEPIASIFF